MVRHAPAIGTEWHWQLVPGRNHFLSTFRRASWEGIEKTRVRHIAICMFNLWPGFPGTRYPGTNSYRKTGFRRKLPGYRGLP
eukprot:1489238-Rhodomonas_salina.2